LAACSVCLALLVDGNLDSKSRNIDRRALDAKVSASKDGSEKAGVGGIALLFNLVAAVQLRVSASLDCLLDGDVANGFSPVDSRVSSVLARVADVLVAVPDLGDLLNIGDLSAN